MNHFAKIAAMAALVLAGSVCQAEVPGCADEEVKKSVMKILEEYVLKNRIAIFDRLIVDNANDPDNVPENPSMQLKRIILRGKDADTGQVSCTASIVGMSAADYPVRYIISPDAEDDDNWFVSARFTNL